MILLTTGSVKTYKQTKKAWRKTKERKKKKKTSSLFPFLLIRLVNSNKIQTLWNHRCITCHESGNFTCAARLANTWVTLFHRYKVRYPLLPFFLPLPRPRHKQTNKQTNARTHTHTHTCIYIYVCAYTCMCV